MHIYVLSSLAHPDRYKVGKHSGTLSALKTRYITAIPDVKIYYFIETPYFNEVENEFKQTHKHARVTNINGNLSEWVNLPLEEIFDTLMTIVAKHSMYEKNGTCTIDYAVKLIDEVVYISNNLTKELSSNMKGDKLMIARMENNEQLSTVGTRPVYKIPHHFIDELTSNSKKGKLMIARMEDAEQLSTVHTRSFDETLSHLEHKLPPNNKGCKPNITHIENNQQISLIHTRSADMIPSLFDYGNIPNSKRGKLNIARVESNEQMVIQPFDKMRWNCELISNSKKGKLNIARIVFDNET